MKYLVFFIILFYSCNEIPAVNYQLIINSDENIINKTSKVTISVNSLSQNHSIKYFLNEIETKPEIDLTRAKLGTNIIKAVLNIDEKDIVITKEFDVFNEFVPEIYNYKIINEFQHDISSYTQGLEFNDGYLYESTGLNGFSSLKKIDVFNNKIIESRFLDKQYFGEGLTIINGKILQLTWKSNLGFIYDLNTLNMLGSFEYGNSKEGWGLANDGNNVYKSDGTDKIWILENGSFNEIDYIEVVTNNKKIKNINELEIVDDLIYANTYQFNKDVCLIIDKKSGAVNGIVNFEGLRERVKKHPDLDVLNGIAFNKKRNSFFVTGKKWNKIFEIKIFKE